MGVRAPTCAQAVHATMPKQSAATSAQEQRDRSILYDRAINELGKLDAPAIKRAMLFMEIEEVYPNKKSRMCALAAGQPQQHRLSGVLTVLSCVASGPAYVRRSHALAKVISDPTPWEALPRMTADTGPWLQGKLRYLEDFLYDVQDPEWISFCKDPEGTKGKP